MDMRDEIRNMSAARQTTSYRFPFVQQTPVQRISAKAVTPLHWVQQVQVGGGMNRKDQLFEDHLN